MWRRRHEERLEKGTQDERSKRNEESWRKPRGKSARGERGHLPRRCWIGQALVIVLRGAPVLENVSHDVVTQQFQV